jgi:hypothetical protein
MVEEAFFKIQVDVILDCTYTQTEVGQIKWPRNYGRTGSTINNGKTNTWR